MKTEIKTKLNKELGHNLGKSLESAQKKLGIKVTKGDLKYLEKIGMVK